MKRVRVVATLGINLHADRELSRALLGLWTRTRGEATRGSGARARRGQGQVPDPTRHRGAQARRGYVPASRE